MKKTLLLLFALLTGVSGAWGETGTVIVKEAADASFEAHGTFSQSKTSWKTMWQSSSTPCLTLTTTNQSRYMSGATMAKANYAMFLPLGYHITGYTISFKSYADGNSKITGYGDKKTEKATATSTGKSDEQTLTVSGISTQSVELKIETNHANVTSFSVTYETSDDAMPFVQGAYYRLQEYTGWVTNYYIYAYRSATNTDRLKKGSATANTILTHSNYIWKASSVSGSQVQFQNELYGYYMAKLPTSASQVDASITSSVDDAETFNVINRTAWETGYFSLLPQSPITTAMTVENGDAISFPFHFLDGCSSTDSLMNGLNYEHQGGVQKAIRVKKVTFSSAVTIGGVPVSTIYVATDGSDSFTLPGGNAYSVNGTIYYSGSEAAAAISAAGTADLTVTVIDCTSNKYRLHQYWRDNGSNDFYVYANIDDGTYSNRLWESIANKTTLLTDNKYLWELKSSDANWIFYNPTADRYINLAQSKSTQGNGIEVLTDDISKAEPFNIIKANKENCFNLKATTQTNIYLDSWSASDNSVGWHTSATHYGAYFKLIPVKTVTFTTAVAVNGGDVVTTIYVAKDGSDSFTLPEENVYCINGVWMNNTSAASAIAEAGESDIEVTVLSRTIALNGPVSEMYYATLCLPFDVTISDATTTAYTLAKSGSWLVPSEVTEVPAGTPVLLKGSNATATVAINTGDAYNGGSPLACALTGTYENMTANTSTNYYLGVKDGVVGFYRWVGTLGAYRAYLTDAAAAVKGFVINWGEETGITETTEKPEGSEAMFDLSGRRVNKAQKGLYIQNGKKLLVK